jgi:bifunctional enzyme CysN/CysC
MISRGTVWFTGLSGAGKTTVAETLLGMLGGDPLWPIMLDGDLLREGLNADLSYSEDDRRENVRRVGEVALLFSHAGHLTLATVISPFRAGRAAVRARHEALGVPFVEIFVATPLEVCEERDPKGLYARAHAGLVPAFTGVSSPYEAPVDPDIAIETTGREPSDCAKEVLALLEARGMIASS